MYGGEHRMRGPAEENSLDQLQGLHRQVESEIQENNAEIRLLNNKIVKYHFLHAEMTMTALSCKNWNSAGMPFSPSGRNLKKLLRIKTICSDRSRSSATMITLLSMVSAQSTSNLPTRSGGRHRRSGGR
jgi:hypothetical protein